MLHRQAAQPQLVAKELFIRRLEQSRSNQSMDLDRRRNDRSSQFFFQQHFLSPCPPCPPWFNLFTPLSPPSPAAWSTGSSEAASPPPAGCSPPECSARPAA